MTLSGGRCWRRVLGFDNGGDAIVQGTGPVDPSVFIFVSLVERTAPTFGCRRRSIPLYKNNTTPPPLRLPKGHNPGLASRAERR